MRGKIAPEIALFRVFGIQLTAHWTWVFLAVLLTFAAAAMFGRLLRHLAMAEIVFLAVLATILSIVSLYAHEVAHALVARRHGVSVDRVSLFLLGGMAHVGHDVPSPRAELLISGSGPVVSLLVGFGALGLGLLVQNRAPVLYAEALWLALINLPLALFNLVPAYPLDGGRVLRAALWFAARDLVWASRVSQLIGQIVAAGLLFAGLLTVFLNTQNVFGGLWLVLVAWFMYGGALAAHRSTVLSALLSQVPVSRVMRRFIPRVQMGESLSVFARDSLTTDVQATLTHGERVPFGVYRGEQLIGLLTMDTLTRVPQAHWDKTPVEQIMTPIGGTPSVADSATAAGALRLLLESGGSVIRVVSDGNEVVGLISRTDLIRAAQRADGRKQSPSA